MAQSGTASWLAGSGLDAGWEADLALDGKRNKGKHYVTGLKKRDQTINIYTHY